MYTDSPVGNATATREELRGLVLRARDAYIAASVVMTGLAESVHIVDEALDRGDDWTSFLKAAGAADMVADLDAALKNVERCRHQVRVGMFRVALEDGASINELARVYGISRQLAQRHAKEARG